MQRHTAIPIVPAVTARTPLLTCHGCRHCWYAAPGGQLGPDYPGRPAILSQPHSRCLALSAYIPMILGPQEKWLGSEVPQGCPEHRQPELFA